MKTLYILLLTVFLSINIFGGGFVRDVSSEWGWRYTKENLALYKGEFVVDDTIWALNYGQSVQSYDPLFYKQWYLDNLNYNNIPSNYMDLVQNARSNVRIFILDSGLPSSPDLKGDKFEFGKNYALVFGLRDTCGCGREDTIYDPWQNRNFDDVGHSTQVTGIIGAVHNDIGIKGIDKNTPITFYKVLRDGGWGYVSWLVYALLDIQNQCIATRINAVVNLSIGMARPYRPLEELIEYLYKIRKIRGYGVTLICAAGNASSEGLDYPGQYSHYGKNNKEGYLNVISVGALNKDNTKSYYSNYGSDVDIWAYGGQGVYIDNNGKYTWGTESVFTTNPDSVQFWAAHFSNPELYPYNYGYFAGTSAAAPQVTAAVARLLNFDNKFDLDKLKDYLRLTGIKFKYKGYIEDKNGQDTETGFELDGYRLDLLKFWFSISKDYNKPKSSKINIFPNPFNPVANIKVKVDTYSKVNVKIYDVLGNEVKELVNEYKNPGDFIVTFNGDGLTSGIYFCRVVMDNTVLTEKMMLIK